MRPKVEQTGKCTEKVNRRDLQTQVSFLKYTLCGKQAASLPLTEQPVCAQTLWRVSLSHTVLKIHIHTPTHTRTLVIGKSE